MPLRRIFSTWVLLSFLFSSLGPLPQARADEPLSLPAPGTMVNLTPAYEPVMIKGLTVHADNPLMFDFIVDTGSDKLSGGVLKKEGEKLAKYFLACLAIPEKDLWVNLSPYEKSRTIPVMLSQTDMGRDLLAQDYILKQLTASLIYPEKALGKAFWDRVYTKARQMYGTSNIPVNTFNKVWIMADRAEIFERNHTVFVLDRHLKVMLEEDYLALQKNVPHPQANTHSISSQIVRAIILPEIEQEVNTGKNFAALRQIFNALILASWYKKNLKQALLNQVYSGQGKIKGIDLSDPNVKDRIYAQYLRAYKKGVFNYIKEETDSTTQQTIPHKYFSGGVTLLDGPATSPAMIANPSAQALHTALTSTGQWARINIGAEPNGSRSAKNPKSAKLNIQKARDSSAAMRSNEERSLKLNLPQELGMVDPEKLPRYLNIKLLQEDREVYEKAAQELVLSPKTRWAYENPTEVEWGTTLTPEILTEINAYLRKKFSNAAYEFLASLLERAIWKKAGVDPNSEIGKRLSAIYPSIKYQWEDPGSPHLISIGRAANDNMEISGALLKEENRDLLGPIIRILKADREICLERYQYQVNFDVMISGIGDQNEENYLPYEVLGLNWKLPSWKDQYPDDFNEIKRLHNGAFSFHHEIRLAFPYYLQGALQGKLDLYPGPLSVPQIVEKLFAGITSNEDSPVQWKVDQTVALLTAAKAQGMSKEADEIWQALRQKLSESSPAMSVAQQAGEIKALFHRFNLPEWEKAYASPEAITEEDLIGGLQNAINHFAPLKKYSQLVDELRDHLEYCIDNHSYSGMIPHSYPDPAMSVAEIKERLNGKTILIVDDHPRDRLYLQIAIDDHKIKFIYAGDGQEAIDKLAAGKEKVDGIIFDFQMPGMNGSSFVRSLKGNPAYSHLPLVAWSGIKSDEVRLEFEKWGVPFFTKNDHPAYKLLGALVEQMLPNSSMLSAGDQMPVMPSWLKSLRSFKMGDDWEIFTADAFNGLSVDNSKGLFKWLIENKSLKSSDGVYGSLNAKFDVILQALKHSAFKKNDMLIISTLQKPRSYRMTVFQFEDGYTLSVKLDPTSNCKPVNQLFYLGTDEKRANAIIGAFVEKMGHSKAFYQSYLQSLTKPDELNTALSAISDKLAQDMRAAVNQAMTTNDDNSLRIMTWLLPELIEAHENKHYSHATIITNPFIYRDRQIQIKGVWYSSKDPVEESLARIAKEYGLELVNKQFLSEPDRRTVEFSSKYDHEGSFQELSGRLTEDIVKMKAETHLAAEASPAMTVQEFDTDFGSMQNYLNVTRFSLSLGLATNQLMNMRVLLSGLNKLYEGIKTMPDTKQNELGPKLDVLAWSVINFSAQHTPFPDDEEMTAAEFETELTYLEDMFNIINESINLNLNRNTLSPEEENRIFESVGLLTLQLSNLTKKAVMSVHLITLNVGKISNFAQKIFELSKYFIVRRVSSEAARIIAQVLDKNKDHLRLIFVHGSKDGVQARVSIWGYDSEDQVPDLIPELHQRLTVELSSKGYVCKIETRTHPDNTTDITITPYLTASIYEIHSPKKPPIDPAMQSLAPVLQRQNILTRNGGIDLNTANMKTTDLKEGAGVVMTFDAAMAAEIRKDGLQSLTPVVYKITPIADIRSVFKNSLDSSGILL